MPIENLLIRAVSEDDSFDRMTDILHAAYAPLGAKGMQYVAVSQPVEVTRKRCAQGQCYIALIDDEMVGTVTLRDPMKTDEYHPYYAQEGVAVFGQFGVDPTVQRQSVGTRMMQYLEGRARELGAREIACDTSVHADHLRAWYTGMGYVEVDTADWLDTNYQSVILAKAL